MDLEQNIESYIKNRLDQYRSWYDNKAVISKKKYLQGRIWSAVGGRRSNCSYSYKYHFTVDPYFGQLYDRSQQIPYNNNFHHCGFADRVGGSVALPRAMEEL